MSESRDMRPAQVAKLTRHAYLNADAVVDALADLTATRPRQPVSRPDRERVTTSATPRPTEHVLVEWEDELERVALQLVGTWTPPGTAPGRPGVLQQWAGLAARRGDVDPDEIEAIADDLRGVPVTSLAWRHAVRAWGTTMHGLITDVHEQWQHLYRARWVLGPKGTTALDGELDQAASWLLSEIRDAAAPLRRIADDVAQRPPTQRELVACTYEVDARTGARCGELAKYARLERCDRHRRRELRDEAERREREAS